MGVVRRTVVEALILGVLAVGVALTANAVRASASSVKLTRNYFDKGLTRVRPAKNTQHIGSSINRESKGTDERSTAKASGEVIAVEPQGDEHLEHPYQEVSIADVVTLFNDPSTQFGLNLFVDARSDHAYEEGHIPGAIQADHYRLVDYIDALLDCAEAAEKIIVYCNGGDCEDSIFLCGDLLDFEVPYEKIYIFPGGWKEWTKNNMPVAKVREGEGEE